MWSDLMLPSGNARRKKQGSLISSIIGRDFQGDGKVRCICFGSTFGRQPMLTRH
jgi:hypothetical protein